MPGYVVGDWAPSMSVVEAHTAECRYCRNELEGFGISIICSPRPKPPAAGSRYPRFRYRRVRWRLRTMEVLGVLLIATTATVCAKSISAVIGTSKIPRPSGRTRGSMSFPISRHPACRQQLTNTFRGAAPLRSTDRLFRTHSLFPRCVRATRPFPWSGGDLSEIAKRIGNPGASRAVAMPWAAIGADHPSLPSHRAADRSIGNYTGGADIKVTLLSLEGSLLPTGTLVP